ncbi:hypothetical protein ACMGD3_12400 [Lysinibacillus sphaericus]
MFGLLDCANLREGRHDVGHFGKAIGRGGFTNVGQLAVSHGCDELG